MSKATMYCYTDDCDGMIEPEDENGEDQQFCRVCRSPTGVATTIATKKLDGEPACEQDGCDIPAVAKVYWPNREPFGACQHHASGIESLAAHMGWTIPIEPMPGFIKIAIPALAVTTEREE